MKKKNNLKAWLYLLPAILFLGIFMLYPLVDVCVYSLEENFHFVSQKYSGIGLGNFRHVLTDPYFVICQVVILHKNLDKNLCNIPT